MKKIGNKRYIISLFVTVFGILALISGTSYAILSGSTVSTNEQVIKAGSVELKLTEKYDNLNKSVAIMTDSDGLLQEDIYEFSITNIGSVAAKYDLKLINSATGEKLTDDCIKVGLEVNGKEFGPMNLDSVHNIIDTNTIYENEIINYKMRLWLNANKVDDITASKSAVLSLKIDAEQSQYAKKKNIPSVVYRFGDNEVMIGDSIAGFDYTEDYTTLNKAYFLKHNISNEGTVASSEACYILNSTLYCLKGGDNGAAYSENTNILQTSFGQTNCSVNSDHVSCSFGMLGAGAYQSGTVSAGEELLLCEVSSSFQSACAGGK